MGMHGFPFTSKRCRHFLNELKPENVNDILIGVHLIGQTQERLPRPRPTPPLGGPPGGVGGLRAPERCFFSSEVRSGDR